MEDKKHGQQICTGCMYNRCLYCPNTGIACLKCPCNTCVGKSNGTKSNFKPIPQKK